MGDLPFLFEGWVEDQIFLCEGWSELHFFFHLLKRQRGIVNLLQRQKGIVRVSFPYL